MAVRSYGPDMILRMRALWPWPLRYDLGSRSRHILEHGNIIYTQCHSEELLYGHKLYVYVYCDLDLGDTAPISLKLIFSASIHCQFVINSQALAYEQSIQNWYQLLNSKELTNLRYLKLIVIRQQLLTVIRFDNVSCRTFVSWFLKSKELKKVRVEISFQMCQWYLVSVSTFDWNFRF